MNTNESGSSLDPRQCIADLFGREYVPYREDVMGRWSPFTQAEECFTSPSGRDRDVAFRLFCSYVHFREQGVDMVVHPIAGELKWKIPDCIHYHWVVMSQKTRDRCFRLFEATHIWCLEKRGIWYRPEFAFLVNFSASFAWAMPYRESLFRSQPALVELEELYDRGPIEDFLPIFFGQRSDEQMERDPYMWEEDHGYPEGATCALANAPLGFTTCRPDFDTQDRELAGRLRSELGELLGKT